MDPTPSPRDAALAVARRLRAAGHEALFCGGAVRDRLLGRTPGDYDVATSATPDAGLRLFPRAVTVGARFGVLVVPGPPDVEVATFRDDGLYVDGRRPTEVRFSDPARDAQRRDFTVNALFEDPETGEVIDHVEGRRDLAARLLRAIGDPRARFAEDHLRVLRAVRFAAQLGFAIEPATWDAVRKMAPTVASVSAERVRDELVRVLAHGRGRGLRLLRDAGLLAIVLPEVAAMQGVLQGPEHHPEGDVFVHTSLVLDGVEVRGAEEEDAVALLFGALLHDVAKPPTFDRGEDGRIRFHGHEALGASMTEAILARLKFPRRTIDRVQALVGQHMQFPNLPRMRPARRRRFLGDPAFPLHLKLHEADCGASHGHLDLADWCRAELRRYEDEPVLPRPLLDGRTLIELGYRPGPGMGRVLAWVRDQQLDDAIGSREDAVRRVREMFPPPGPDA